MAYQNAIQDEINGAKLADYNKPKKRVMSKLNLGLIKLPKLALSGK